MIRLRPFSTNKTMGSRIFSRDEMISQRLLSTNKTEGSRIFSRDEIISHAFFLLIKQWDQELFHVIKR